MCPFYTVVGMYELYKQLLPTKLYTSKRIKTCLPDDVMCQLCGKCPESSPHIFAEYSKVRAKRVDARIVDHQEKTVKTLEMSCPWIQN